MDINPHVLLKLLDEDLLKITPWSETHTRAMQTLRGSLLKKSSYGRTAECRDRAILAFKQRAARNTAITPDAPFARGALAIWLKPSPLDTPLITSEGMFEGMKPGPGSSIGMFDRSTCSMLKLFHGKISASNPEVYHEYLGLIREYSPVWYGAEIKRRQIYGDPDYVSGNKVTTVPKDDKIDRVIAVEPTVNSVLQQGVKHILEGVLGRLGIDLTKAPDINRRLARRGSLGGGLATVDFSAASDSISVELLRYLLPQDVVDYILFVSSPQFNVDGEWIQADKIALSMGNAITFPLQTLIFLALCLEVFRRRGRQFIIGTNVNAFGDDVIIPDDMAEEFCELAIQCGFSPNMEKSFWAGDFRESCGTDWISGHNVRGVYLKELRGTPAVYTARNLLFAWSHRWQIDLQSVLRYLDDLLIADNAMRLVPLHAPINSGVRCHSCPEGSYNSRKQAFRYVCLTSSFRSRRKQRLMDANPLGALWASFYGGIVGGKLNERPRSKVQLRERKVYTSWTWDFPHPEESWLYDTTRGSGGSLVPVDHGCVG